MSRLSPEGRGFLEATRRLDEPTDVDRRRIHAKTLAALAAASAAGTLATRAAAAEPGSALAPGSAAPGWAGGTLAGAITGALLAVAVLGGWAAFDLATGHDGAVRPAHTGGVSREPPRPGGAASAPPIQADPVRARGEASAAPAALTAPATLPRPLGERGGDGARARAPAASPQPPAPPTPVANAMDEEIAALRDAQEALRAGRPAEAVRVLDRFAATHTSVALEEERRAARIVAACKAGGGSEARADAERFLRERPDAVLGERVRTACLQKASP